MCAQCVDPRNTNLCDDLRNKQRSNWFFTWNNYDKNSIVQLCSYFKKYTFQEEIGSDNNTRHLQGVVIKRCRFSQLKKEFPSVHWEVCKNIFAAKQYCTKLDTRNGKIYSEGMDQKKKIVIKDYFSKHKPYKWQQDIISLYKTEPDERKVYWYWENNGNKGKSSLTRHMILTYDVLAVSGGSRDIKCGIAKAIEKDKDIRMIIIDIPRSAFANISYKVIEEIKNGFFYSTKYDSDMFVFNIPHVVVFANTPPNKEMLSNDRWVINLIS